MSRRVLIAAVAVAFAVACSLGASTALAESSAATGIELVGGSGRAVLNLRGSLLGRLERGEVTITDHADAERTEILVLGWDWKREVDAQTVAYGGERLRFRIFRGLWRVRIDGSGIDAAAVGRGTVGLRGRGRYSLDGAPYRAWPLRYRTIRLGE